MQRRFRSAVSGPYRTLAWLLALIVSACAGSRCDSATNTLSGPGKPANTPRPDLRLVLLTDPRGYLEPCGCQVRPLGGLDKLATVVAEARRESVPTALFAAGNLAFGTELRPEDTVEARAQEIYRAETFVDVYKRIGFNAVTPGMIDLKQEPELVAKIVERGGFPWILDNTRGESKPFAEARIVEVQGIKVGVLGVNAPETVSGGPAGKAMVELDGEFAAVVKRETSELKLQGARLIVALLSGDRRSARVVANQGADVVLLGGVDLERALPPSVVGDAVILHAGQQGQHVLTVDIGLGQSGAWEDASEWSTRERKKDLEQQIRELKARIASWEKDEKVVSRDLDAQRARLSELEHQRDTERTLSFKGRWFRADLKELAPEVKGDADIAALLDRHDRRVNDHNKTALADRKPVAAAEGKPAYVGSESCGTANCHKQAYDWWRSTKHGKAYATLENVHKEFNLNCVGCHVTGYNQPGGSTVTHVESLKDVGCESCHGPGSLHNAAPEQQGLVARAVPEATCVGCHTHEHSDRFVYDSFRAMLIVPGHGRPSDRQ